MKKWQETQRKGMLKFQKKQREKNLEKLKAGTLYPKQMAKKRKKKTLEEKKLTVSYWKEELWKVFSIFIRLRDSDEYGYCYCISCGKKLFWKSRLQGAHAGHFIPRAEGNAVYFNEKNVNAQCYHCNIKLSGNQYKYSIALDKKCGEGTSAELRKTQDMSGQVKFTIPQLQEMIFYYEGENTKLLKTKSL